MRSLPHIVYLSRGRLFEHSGGRDKDELLTFARRTLNRHTQQRRTEAEEEGHEDDEAAAAAAGGGSSSARGEDEGRPVPAAPSQWSVFHAALLEWAGQLHQTLTTLPAVSIALVAVGVLLGVLLTLLAFALLLPNEVLPPAKAAVSSARRTAAATQSDGASKARKAD